MSEPLRVLIIEDSEDDTLLMVRELERAGFEVRWERVASAEALREALGDPAQGLPPWDVVIADYRMPGFGGMEALEIVRRRDPDLPLIVVSGSAGEELAVEAMRAGAQDYVMKDRLSRLAPAVERELRDAEVRRQRRRAEEALRESEERYRQLFEHSPDGIAVLCDGIVVLCNPALARMLGGVPGDLIGKTIEELAPSSEAEELAGRLREVIRWGQPTAVFESKLARSGGGTVDVQLVAAPTTHLGRPAVQIVVRDITDYRRMQEQLLRSQRMEAIGTLTGGIAHDFNNLLMPILGYTEAVIEDLGPDHPNTEDLRMVQDAAARAARLTRQLLSFSRRQVLQLDVLDLNRHVLDLVKMLERIIGEDIELHTRLAPDLWPVKADAGQLQQVLMNLAINARDAMPHGGQLVVETQNASIGPDYARTHYPMEPGDYVLLAVSDTGCGMDEATRERVFEPFFTTKREGTGLGLSTVYGIVKQHGGYIWVYSEPGQGTTFKIYLPRAADEAAPTPEPEIEEIETDAGETVLLVEDNEPVRILACTMLANLGYQPIEAKDPDEAIQVAATHQGPIHLLLTDVVLPRMNGKELYERLAAQRPDLRVLYMSGYSEETIAHRGILDAGVHYLQKPFSLRTLGREVKRALRP